MTHTPIPGITLVIYFRRYGANRTVFIPRRHKQYTFPFEEAQTVIYFGETVQSETAVIPH
jgi:hypothetical protein